MTSIGTDEKFQIITLKETNKVEFKFHSHNNNNNNNNNNTFGLRRIKEFGTIWEH